MTGRLAYRATVFILAALIVQVPHESLRAQEDTPPASANPRVETSNPLFRPQHQTLEQGFDIRTWLSNGASIGQTAFWTDLTGAPPNLYGFEYPQGSGIEHLLGAGVWVGALVDTSHSGNGRLIHAVSTGGNGYNLEAEMWGHPDGRDSFFTTSMDLRNGHNRRNVDDDNDGKIDEDELDGFDNDGDWDEISDDLGTDGLPDPLETGCRGGYDPVTNPDPSNDNWDSSATDQCLNVGARKSNRYWYTQGNGYPNHGEPHVDEDYGAVSEHDVYVSFTDIYGNPSPIPAHIPLGIKVWQRSFAWRSRLKAPILPFDYEVINIGDNILDSVYIGFFTNSSVGPSTAQDYFNNNATGYFSQERTGYTTNPVNLPSTPVGVTFLHIPGELDSLRYAFQWYPIDQSPSSDEQRYALMSSAGIKPDEYPSTSNTRFLMAAGPVKTRAGTKIFPGDTIRFALALLSGDALERGTNNLRENARTALELYQRGWATPVTPPSPPLKIQRGNLKVTLDWHWHPGDPSCDPLETWDDSSRFVEALPDTHWRRRNPELRCPPSETVHPSGGRVFEGFRVWRSESPSFDRRTFTLLAQYDVIDDLRFENETGLQYTFVDSNLIRGKRYWYAVTSFSIPRITIVDVPDSSGAHQDTLVSSPLESDVGENSQLVILPFDPSARAGEVKVVPNPYRTDVDYTYEGGGWEGLSRFWNENRRVIWFIHLPPRCTIHIMTLAGDVVAVLEHDDASRMQSADRPPGQEEWNLLSGSGRAIASGIYVFVVDSDFGKQIGKFVVIR